MKKGIDLAQLTTELEYQQENRQDIKTNTEGMSLLLPTADSPQWKLIFPVPSSNGDKPKTQTLPITSNVLTQIAKHTHFSYAEMLRIAASGTDREKKALSTFLSIRLQEHPTSRKVRTVARFWEDPQVVAFVDSRFECESAFKILTAILGLGLQVKGLQFASANLTDNYMTVCMTAAPRDGIASGLMFEYSEVGLLSCVRPLFVNEAGHTIIPANHHIFGWDNVSVETAKQCLMGARSAVKKYTELAQRKLAENIDLARLLEEQGLTRDEIRKVLGHYNKSVMIHRSHQELVNAVAKYAALGLSLTYERTVELECVAGTLMDFTNDSFKAFAKSEDPTPIVEEKKADVKSKKAPKQGKKPAKS